MSLTLHIKLDFVLVCYNFIHIRKYNLLFLESRNAEVQGLALPPSQTFLPKRNESEIPAGGGWGETREYGCLRKRTKRLEEAGAAARILESTQKSLVGSAIGLPGKRILAQCHHQIQNLCTPRTLFQDVRISIL